MSIERIQQFRTSGILRPEKDIPVLWVEIASSLTTASDREGIAISSQAGLLACNIFAILPAFGSGVQGQKLWVTYSCATARDLHTIPC